MNSPLPTSAIAWPDAQREQAFTQWLNAVAPRHGLLPASLRSASTDASFRRYLRLDAEDGTSRIVMDAAPPLSDVRPFISVAALLHGAALHGPQVLEADVPHGFLLLTDLGTTPYLDALTDAVARNEMKVADGLMRDAIAALVQWQLRIDATVLPPYDEAFVRRELQIFPDWCVEREHGVVWTAEQQATWANACNLLVANALAQPTVAMHRDYMPRNLMVASPNPGILDFQDAVRGPISYDVASLLRDAFISWDEEQEIDWAVRYWEAARKAKLPVPADFGEFWTALEWMGLQRHLKVLGIFSRLKHRDGKPHYISDLPRFYRYAHKVADRYNALRPLARMLEPLMGLQRIEGFY